MQTTPNISFITTIPQLFVNSEAQEETIVVNPQTFVATNFASMDSVMLLSSDVTNDVSHPFIKLCFVI